MKLPKFFTTKKIIWTAIIVLVVGYVGYRVAAPKDTTGSIQTDTVKRQHLEQTVLTTGQVVSRVDLQLSFKTGGRVSRVSVAEGDAVKAGQVLASLDEGDQLAAVTQAGGALASAQAALDKLKAGAASSDVAVYQSAVLTAQTSLDNTIASQNQAVANALGQLLGLQATASAASSNISTATLSVSGTYTGDQPGTYIVRVDDGSAPLYSASGLEVTGRVPGSRTTPTLLGTLGLKLQWSSVGTLYGGDTWTIELPNKSSTSYASYEAAYEAALATQTQVVGAARRALADAEAKLAQVQAPARSYDLQAAEANVESARGALIKAQADLSDRTLVAPATGTVTLVNVKVGEQAVPSVKVVALQDVAQLHLEANVSEADIASVAPGQSIDVTFDALGVGRHFKATVQTVNPASTVVSGVVNYKVTASLDDISSIKPGMTANMTILVAQKDNALAVPQQAIINQDHSQYVRVVDNLSTKTYHLVPVQTGISADGGMLEITNGLTEGQTVVTYLKQ